MRKLRIVQKRWWSVISNGARGRSWVVCESSISSPFEDRFFHDLMRDIKRTDSSFVCAIA
jgi:hypothetical protein